LTTKPAKEKFKCTEPGCTAEYDDSPHLGIHKRAAHGIKGKSYQANRARKLREEAKAAAAQTAEPKPKRTYTKRSNQLATIPTETTRQSNGHTQANGLASRAFYTETAIAVAVNRVQELCKSVAFEYDLPPKSFTAQLITLLYAQTLR